MGILDTIKEKGQHFGEMALQPALDTVVMFINHHITRYGQINKIKFDSKRLVLDFTLLGLEKEPLNCSVGHIYINDDISKVQFGDFQANKPFLKNALDDFATREFLLPDNAKLKIALKVIKKFLK